MADSIAIFSEGTFEEQLQELAAFILKDQPEDESNVYTAKLKKALGVEEGAKPIELDLGHRKTAFSMVLAMISKEEHLNGSDSEIEGFWNLLFSNLFSLYHADTLELKTHVDQLLQLITIDQEAALSYRLLSNFLNAIPRRSPLRLPVYKAILQLAISQNELHSLKLDPKTVEKWLSEWEITKEDKSLFLKSLMDGYTKTGYQENAYAYNLLYVKSLDPTSVPGKAAAVKAIASALRIPSILDFDPLFRLEAVMSVKDHDLFSLLRVFLNEDLHSFRQWDTGHPGAISKYGLEQTTLERKIRLLTLASIAFKSIAHDLSYAAIVKALDIDYSEVEKWVIDGIRTGVISGKLSQTTQSFHVTRAIARTFERAEWEALEQRLLAWKNALTDVLAVVASTQSAGPPMADPSKSKLVTT